MEESLHPPPAAWLQPELRLFGRAWPAYRTFVFLGVGLGALLAVALAWHERLSVPIMGLVVVLGVVVAVAFGLATKLVMSEERFTFYHYQVMILAVAAGVLALLGRPVLLSLDVTILALGMVQACGRLGCLRAGCCHGRPWSWGVRYGAEHAALGFPRALVGVRLVPVQAVESLWVFGLTVAGSVLLVRGQTPGEALLFYVIGYGAGRFGFELLRGDEARPYRGGFSEAQWTSFFLMTAAAGASLAGFLPRRPAAIAVAALVYVAMAAMALWRRLAPAPGGELVHPHHLTELAGVLARLDRTAGPESPFRKPAPFEVRVDETSRGLRVSCGRLAGAAGGTVHYSLSSTRRPLSSAAAARVAGLILRLRPAPGLADLVEGAPGVFHLVVPPVAPETSG